MLNVITHLRRLTFDRASLNDRAELYRKCALSRLRGVEGSEINHDIVTYVFATMWQQRV